MSREPARETMTGSTTSGVSLSRRTCSATTMMISRLASMPVFAAVTPMSETTASI
jgi:hypothetical protein